MSIASVNLISPQRASRTRVRRATLRWARGLGFYALCLGVLGVVVSASRTRQGELRESVSLLEAKVAAGKAEQVGEMKRVEDLRKRLRAAHAVGMHADWAKLLKTIAARSGEAITLERLEVHVTRNESAGRAGSPASGQASGQASAPSGTQPSGQAGGRTDGRRGPREAPIVRSARVDIGGRAVDLRSVQEFALRLEELGFFQQVRLISTTPGDEEGLSFDVQCIADESAMGMPGPTPAPGGRTPTGEPVQPPVRQDAASNSAGGNQ